MDWNQYISFSPLCQILPVSRLSLKKFWAYNSIGTFNISVKWSRPILMLSDHRLLNNYTALSAVALWFQDFFLTFPTEVRTIWSRKMTGSSILFLLSRYSFMLFAAIQLVLFLPGHMTAMRFVCLLSVNEDVGLTLEYVQLQRFEFYSTCCQHYSWCGD